MFVCQNNHRHSPVVKRTWRVGDDGVEECTAAKWVLCDIKCGKIQDPFVYCILSSSTNNTRYVLCRFQFSVVDVWCERVSETFSTHLPTIDVGTKDESAEMGGSLSIR
jgi:hypothetical protein